MKYSNNFTNPKVCDCNTDPTRKNYLAETYPNFAEQEMFVFDKVDCTKSNSQHWYPGHLCDE